MTVWSRDQAMLAADQPQAALPVITAADVVPMFADLDLWDMWPIADAAGDTAVLDGRRWWFFLAAPRSGDPEDRHDAARIRLTSHGADGWRDHGDALPAGFAPGTREWSGSAVIGGDGRTVTLYFTAAGEPETPRRFAQRLFETTGRFAGNRIDGWSPPLPSLVADGTVYARADQAQAVDGRIKGFRDPGYFRDPADGAEYLLFTGSAAGSDRVEDGVIGIARRERGSWRAQPPLLTAIGVNSELERPHIVTKGGGYYLFWSTQARRFAPGIGAPTGLYGMVAEIMAGPWRPLNGSALVAANPPAEPFQAYCWWVTGEGEVISFVDYWGLAGGDPGEGAAFRRAHFGGTVAPLFRLALAGTKAEIIA